MSPKRGGRADGERREIAPALPHASPHAGLAHLRAELAALGPHSHTPTAQPTAPAPAPAPAPAGGGRRFALEEWAAAPTHCGTYIGAEGHGAAYEVARAAAGGCALALVAVGGMVILVLGVCVGLLGVCGLVVLRLLRR
ncbi:hypothetical protein CC85DRAFT_288725 [Cutaneotrichosporon oleaginosum]|uniref:Uncharacterized protein n=1 Tax=Cutaneotrichosporon oleaginosum TaxID=879819 RepID=A0A0J1AVG8_9TREE|nr:uncharacterized protein CC85DRAFT_288725 [Cutaneotrichosporon oleaginosum]KLT39284.1 hypothetical protein CC85DRAFT_288725 [Cutaneotrichosporon oleaginosum]